MNQISKQRILGIALSSRGFGYAVMENQFVDYGKKVMEGNKNTKSIAGIQKLIARYRPDVLVLPDVDAKGTYRAPRIKRLYRKVVTSAKKQRLKVVKISGMKLRLTLLGNERGTRQEMAEMLAKRFPVELASRLPPKRKLYNSEDVRMDMFEAVGLAAVYGDILQCN